MTVVKTIVGLFLCLALLSVMQTVGIHALMDAVRSGSNAGLPIGNTPVASNFDAQAIKRGITATFGAVDTREGQRLAIESAARRIDIQNRNALSHVPLPGRFGR